VVIAALVLGWSVFVKQEVAVPVRAPIANDENNKDSESDEVITDFPDVEDNENNDISEVDTSNWNVYKNEEYGFEIKYPKDWKYKIQEGGLGMDYGINFIDSENKNNFIFFNLGPASYSVKDADKHAQKDFEIRDLKIESKEDVIIDGIKGVKYISDYDNPINKKYISACWIKDNFYLLETYIKLENKSNEIVIISIFNQMLSTIKFIESYNHKTFQSDRLKISFEYPTEWQNLLESEGDFSEANAIHPSRIRISIGNLKDNPVILEADNGGDRMGRGRFTGDIVIDVDSQDYIKNFCQNQENKNINKCEFKVNSNNINFVKYEDELCREGGCFGKGLFYLIYNPNSEYQGTLLYTYNIQKDKTAPNSEEEIIFDSLIDSLKFGK